GTKGDTGNTGAPGTPGVSITSVTPYYQQKASGTAAPSTPSGTTPPAPWTAAEPDYVVNTELYRTERITWSSGSPSYTPVVKVSSYIAAEQARALALAVDARALSRGTDLITNGTGYLGNNYNWSTFTLNPDSPA